MATAPDSKGLPRFQESDVSLDGTASGLWNRALGWIADVLDPTDTGWQGVTLNSGWTHHDAGIDPVRIRRRHGQIYISGRVAKTSGAGIDVFSLPAGYRPSRVAIISASHDAGVARLWIGTDGSVQVLNSAGTALSSVSVTIPPLPVP